MVVLVAGSEHSSSKASNVSPHSCETEEKDHVFSRLAFAFLIAGVLTQQTKWIPMLACHMQKGPHLFLFFFPLFFLCFHFIT